jgi:HlyD family secretion protein
MTKGSGKWLIAAAVVTALGIAAAYAWHTLRQQGIPPGFVSGNGRLEATEIDIATKFPGRIQEVLTKEGDTVDAGQVVAHMDTRELEHQLNEAAAHEQQARDSKVTDEAVARLAQSQYEFAARDYERSVKLSEANVISAQKLDSDRTKMENDQAALLAIRAKIVADSSAILAAMHRRERLQTQIDDSELKAPARGRVQYRLAEPGEVLAAGGKVITIINLTDVYMTLFLPELEAGKVAIGADARIVLDAAPDRPIAASVSYVAANAQFTPKSVETATEREKLVFRIKVQIAPQLLRRIEPWIKIGVPGLAYIRVDPDAAWPVNLETSLPIELPAVGTQR